jgi:hypothetical protein
MVSVRRTATGLFVVSAFFIGIHLFGSISSAQSSYGGSGLEIHIAFLATSAQFALPAAQLMANIRSLTAATLYFHILTEISPAEMAAALGKAGSSPRVLVHQVLGPEAAIKYRLPLLQYEAICNTTSLGGKDYHNCKKMITHVLHKVLPDVDRLVMMDTDMFVISDMAELWAHFESFSPTQVIGMSLEQQPTYLHCWGSEQSKRQYQHAFGFPGFNSGLQLMDLAKMRKSRLLERYLSDLQWVGESKRQLAEEAAQYMQVSSASPRRRLTPHPPTGLTHSLTPPPRRSLYAQANPLSKSKGCTGGENWDLGDQGEE